MMKKLLIFVTVIFSQKNIYGQAVAQQNYNIGDTAQGGIIFFLDSSGQHGLVAAPFDQNDGEPIRWYSGKFATTFAWNAFIFGGKANTDLIITNAGKGDLRPYAALVCEELKITRNGVTYSDWYLPSDGELYLLRYSKASNLESGTSYWSSSELAEKDGDRDPSNSAWFIEGYTLNYGSKQFERKVRAIRYF